MPVQTYIRNYACTLAQFNTMTGTTLPAAGFTVIQAPQKFQGIIKATSGGATGMGQVDFSYDGKYFVRFYGANPVPVAEQTSAGVPQTNLLAALITYLDSTLLATLGAPVPSNQAVPPAFVP